MKQVLGRQVGWFLGEEREIGLWLSGVPTGEGEQAELGLMMNALERGAGVSKSYRLAIDPCSTRS